MLTDVSFGGTWRAQRQVAARVVSEAAGLAAIRRSSMASRRGSAKGLTM